MVAQLKRRPDFPSDDEYARYVSEKARPGQPVRCCKAYEEVLHTFICTYTSAHLTEPSFISIIQFNRCGWGIWDG